MKLDRYSSAWLIVGIALTALSGILFLDMRAVPAEQDFGVILFYAVLTGPWMAICLVMGPLAILVGILSALGILK